MKIYRKIKERKLILENLSWASSNIESERRVRFDHERKLLIAQYHSYPFKCFSIIIPYSSLFTRKLRECIFPEGVLISQEKNTSRSTYFLRKYDRRCRYFSGWRVIFVREHIFTVKPGTFFSHIVKKTSALTCNWNT